MPLGVIPSSGLGSSSSEQPPTYEAAVMAGVDGSVQSSASSHPLARRKPQRISRWLRTILERDHKSRNDEGSSTLPLSETRARDSQAAAPYLLELPGELCGDAIPWQTLF